MKPWQLYLALVVAGIGGGLGIGWSLWKPAPAVVETPAPAVRQPDSSLVLERKPDAKAKAPVVLPKGQTLDRVVQATVQPAAPTILHDTIRVPATTGPTPAHEVVKVDTVYCPPVRVQLTLTDGPDGSHRVIASSPDGRVTGGLDIPVKNTVAPRVLRWSLSAVYGSSGRYGGALGRDAGPLHLSAGVLQAPKGGAMGFVGVGLRF